MHLEGELKIVASLRIEQDGIVSAFLAVEIDKEKREAVFLLTQFLASEIPI